MPKPSKAFEIEAKFHNAAVSEKFLTVLSNIPLENYIIPEEVFILQNLV